MIFFMKSLKDSLRKTLAHRHLGKAMVGAVALNIARNFLISQEQGTRDKEQVIDGFVRFNVMFLKTNDQSLKIKIFQQKNQILQEVNLALEKIGYKTVLQEIRLQ